MESLYSLGSRLVDDIASMVTDSNDTSSSTIASPKMTESLNEYYQKKFGSGISSMLNLSTDSPIDQPSTKTKVPENAITTGETDGANESSTKETNDTDKGNADQTAKTTGKSSESSKKEKMSLPASTDS